jgi:hypothetical protein
MCIVQRVRRGADLRLLEIRKMSRFFADRREDNSRQQIMEKKEES